MDLSYKVYLSYIIPRTLFTAALTTWGDALLLYLVSGFA